MLALGFGSSAEAAITLARTALTEPFSVSWERQLTAWTHWHAACAPEEDLSADLPQECAAQVHTSTMVLRVHQDKTYPGAMVASLSVPWGNTREEREGYHLGGRAICVRAPVHCWPWAHCPRRQRPRLPHRDPDR